eukprot:26165-Pleurochrysis_carterae.AAC.1
MEQSGPRPEWSGARWSKVDLDRSGVELDRNGAEFNRSGTELNWSYAGLNRSGVEHDGSEWSLIGAK